MNVGDCSCWIVVVDNFIITIILFSYTSTYLSYNELVGY